MRILLVSYFIDCYIQSATIVETMLNSVASHKLATVCQPTLIVLKSNHLVSFTFIPNSLNSFFYVEPLFWDFFDVKTFFLVISDSVYKMSMRRNLCKLFVVP